MAKSLLQGKIGYFVNGKLVHMPKRNVKVENINEAEKKRKGSSKAKKAAMRNARQDWIMSRLEDLKNESKRGRMKQAFSLLAEIDAYENFKTLPVLQELTKTGVKHLFEADMEERSAIYYAAYSGNFHLLEFYLSLFLVYYVKLDPVNVGTYQTFRDWFAQIGTTQLKLRKSFTMTAYDTCFLNALNEKTRFILSRKNVSIDQAIQCIEKNLNSQESVRLLKPKISVIQEKMFRMGPACSKEKRNKRKPSLIIDDCDYSTTVEDTLDSGDEQ